MSFVAEKLSFCDWIISSGCIRPLHIEHNIVYIYRHFFQKKEKILKKDIDKPYYICYTLRVASAGVVHW